MGAGKYPRFSKGKGATKKAVAAMSKAMRMAGASRREDFLDAMAVDGRVVRNRAPRIKGAIAPFGGRKELKYVDLVAATYVADTTGTVTALNLIAVGDDNTSRDGRQATIKSVQVRGYIRPVDGITSFGKCRLMLVWDNAVNSGAIATIAQILSASTATTFPLIDNAQRFTVLVDMPLVLGGYDGQTATLTLAATPTIHNIEIYKRINAVTQYSGTTAAIGSIQNGGLLMVTIGDQAAGAGGLFNLATRVRFTDD